MIYEQSSSLAISPFTHSCIVGGGIRFYRCNPPKRRSIMQRFTLICENKTELQLFELGPNLTKLAIGETSYFIIQLLNIEEIKSMNGLIG